MALLDQAQGKHRIQAVFSVGELVRVRKYSGGIYEITRILPVTEDGALLYLIRDRKGIQTIFQTA